MINLAIKARAPFICRLKVLLANRAKLPIMNRLKSNFEIDRSASGSMGTKGASKYHPLFHYLQRCDQLQVDLTFAEIEALMGEPLPPSARQKRMWWSNRRKGALQANAWMDAGFVVDDLNLAAERVTFKKPPSIYKVQQVDGIVQWNGELVKALRKHLGLTQVEFASQLGVRQQTVSEWEKGVYSPTRASSNHLTLFAEKVAFQYEIGESQESECAVRE